jgi:hypothetical protein
MAYRFLGKWDRSPDGESPSAWIDEETGDFILQGWIVDDASVRAELLAGAEANAFPESETVIRFPADMLSTLTEVHQDDGQSKSG